jgi:hypothetical protein
MPESARKIVYDKIKEGINTYGLLTMNLQNIPVGTISGVLSYLKKEKIIDANHDGIYNVIRDYPKQIQIVKQKGKRKSEDIFDEMMDALTEFGDSFEEFIEHYDYILEYNAKMELVQTSIIERMNHFKSLLDARMTNYERKIKE